MNGGNFCYRNAAVQCLARVTPLTEFLLKDENIASISKYVGHGYHKNFLSSKLLETGNLLDFSEELLPTIKASPLP